MNVIYINHYLTDTDVANFARQSFAKLAENFTDKQNHSLIRFLARGMASGDWENLINKMVFVEDEHEAQALATDLRSIPCHWVPFGHPHISLRMQAPLPIARQLFKHKIGFVESEESRRYIHTEPEIFTPAFFRAKPEGSVKQGSGGMHPRSDLWLEAYRDHCEDALGLYDDMINAGICPEQARFVLPQGTEVNWVWTGSLYAFANVYNQRSDTHAQVETQEIAKKIGDIIKPLFPVSWAALTDGEY
jgi:thymidylate synthase (FAD)